MQVQVSNDWVGNREPQATPPAKGLFGPWSRFSRAVIAGCLLATLVSQAEAGEERSNCTAIELLEVGDTQVLHSPPGQGSSTAFVEVTEPGWLGLQVAESSDSKPLWLEATSCIEGASFAFFDEGWVEVHSPGVWQVRIGRLDSGLDSGLDSWGGAAISQLQLKTAFLPRCPSTASFKDGEPGSGTEEVEDEPVPSSASGLCAFGDPEQRHTVRWTGQKDGEPGSGTEEVEDEPVPSSSLGPCTSEDLKGRQANKDGEPGSGTEEVEDEPVPLAGNPAHCPDNEPLNDFRAGAKGLELSTVIEARLDTWSGARADHDYYALQVDDLQRIFIAAEGSVPLEAMLLDAGGREIARSRTGGSGFSFDLVLAPGRYLLRLGGRDDGAYRLAVEAAEHHLLPK